MGATVIYFLVGTHAQGELHTHLFSAKQQATTHVASASLNAIR